MSGPPYADLGDLPEAQRIRVIGQLAQDGKVVSFVTDDDEKLDRYLAQIRRLFPRTRLVERGTGPVPNTVWAKVGPAES